MEQSLAQALLAALEKADLSPVEGLYDKIPWTALEKAAKGSTDGFSFTFVSGSKMTASDAADALDNIAGMVRNDFTSGDAQGAGWWDVRGLKADVFYQVDDSDSDGVIFIVGDDDPNFPQLLTSWDTTDAGREFLEGLAEKLNEGHEIGYLKGLLDKELAQVRLRRLGYDWTDDWETGQQRWTLTGPDGQIRLPSGGYHGWNEAVEIATRDADLKALDATPPE